MTRVIFKAFCSSQISLAIRQMRKRKRTMAWLKIRKAKRVKNKMNSTRDTASSTMTLIIPKAYPTQD